MPWIDPEVGLTLGRALYEMLKLAKKNGQRLPISDVLLSLPVEGRKIATQLVSVLEETEARLRRNFPKLDKPLSVYMQDTNFFRTSAWFAVRDCNSKIYGLKTNLQFLLDDFVAIARCAETTDIPAETFKSLQPRIEELDSLMRSDRPLNEVFKILISEAKNLRDAFGDFRFE